MLGTFAGLAQRSLRASGEPRYQPHVVSPALPDTQAEKHTALCQNSRGRCARLPAPPPAARVQAAEVHGPAFISESERGSVTPGHRDPPRGKLAPPGEARARPMKSGSHSPLPESAPGREVTQTQGDGRRISEGLPASTRELGFLIPLLLLGSHDYKKKKITHTHTQPHRNLKAESVCLCLPFVILHGRHQNCLCWVSNSSPAEASMIRTF